MYRLTAVIMVKYKVSYKNVNNLTVERTTEKVKQAIKFVQLCIEFGIKEIKIEQFNFTEK